MKTTFVQKLALGCCLAAAAAFVRPATAQAGPDFDAVPWTAIGCAAQDLIAETSPSSVDFTGNAMSSPAFYAFDADYLYFRYRMDADPRGPHGFDQYSWTALMQVPSGNAFQYQYQLSLNGKDDTIEVWANTSAQDIEFSPLFQDDAEVKLWSQPFTGLARAVTADTSFGGGADWFVDFAFPVSVLVGNGVVADAGELADSFFFPATSTNSNNYNKGHLNCSFLPSTTLAISKNAVPATSLPANTTTQAGFVVTVTNVGALAKGITVDDAALPSFLGNVQVTTTSDDASVTPVVVSTSPVRVRADRLPAGASITIGISGDATPTCADDDFTNVAGAYAVNAGNVSAQAVMDVRKGGDAGGELCDGVDNDCDGVVDENTDAGCDDGNPCNGMETCGGASGCQAGIAPSCSDGNACTVDSCVDGVGCAHQAVPGCTPCTTAAECNDGNGCTAESCTNGICGSTPIPGCRTCNDAADCNDGNACTTESCNAGVCGETAIPGCTPCTTAADCNDGNACTTESCNAGACGETAVPGCTPCTTAADCNDGNACTTESCNAGACGETAVPGCTPCTTAADCNDGNACTTESCNAGACGETAIPGCVPCSDDSACGDDNACTTDACVAGACSNQAQPGCVPCTTAAECGDGSGCTTDTCDAGICAHSAINGCVSCASVTDCADGNGCSDDTCSADGVCSHSDRSGCVPCKTISDCDDHDACTADLCQADGSCGHVAIPGCVACNDVTQCNDGDDCTTDACTAGRCEHTQAAECACTPSPEVCGDGIDNDCDGQTDCDDANCSAAPGCAAAPTEICGNCIDDDGDGLVDYEDPDCCGEQMPLGLRRMTLKVKAAHTRGNGLRVKALNAHGSRAAFDPTRQDTTLQVADDSGELFCTTIAAKYWKKKGKSFRFRDKTRSFAGGLKKARFKIKKNGQIVFRTNGRKMSLRAPSQSSVDVTLRVGGACWEAPATLRKKKNTLTAP